MAFAGTATTWMTSARTASARMASDRTANSGISANRTATTCISAYRTAARIASSRGITTACIATDWVRRQRPVQRSRVCMVDHCNQVSPMFPVDQVDRAIVLAEQP